MHLRLELRVWCHKGLLTCRRQPSLHALLLYSISVSATRISKIGAVRQVSHNVLFCQHAHLLQLRILLKSPLDSNDQHNNGNENTDQDEDDENYDCHSHENGHGIFVSSP